MQLIHTQFQSTHPGGVRRNPCGWQRRSARFQSTHPGGVRPSWRGDGGLKQYISIHAPGWGATKPALVADFAAQHFNPRTRVGCDSKTDDILSRLTRFQSTHPGGVRLVLGADTAFADDISIHAPGWGATRGRITARRFIMNFNPRTRVGCDCPPGATPIWLEYISIHAPGWGATKALLKFRRFPIISIHAPGWGATVPGM